MAGIYGDESETVIVFDYPGEVVSIYTTREGVKNQIMKRAGTDATLETFRSDGREVAWEMTVDIDACRSADLITKP
jgi:hypothetical protein